MTHAVSALTLVRFLDRAAAVYGGRTAVIDDGRSLTYRDLHDRCQRLAGALVANGLRPGGRFAALSHNSLEMLEAHYGIPYAAGVLVPLNARLSATEIAYILAHSGAEVLIATDSLGVSVGKIALRGNNVTPEYYLDPAATAAAVPDGWFRSGDLAVRHPDGYLEIRDRAKDVIISGGENISSVEIESAILEHPAVLEAAVIGVPHEHWGERPAAFVLLRPGTRVTSEELRAHLRERVAKFKVPDQIEFTTLPKTATGKIQKSELRRQLTDRAGES